MYNTLKLYRFNILIPLRANILRNWDYIRKWRLRKISDRQLVNILGVIVGFLSGLSAIILKNTVYYTHAFITSDFGFGNNSFLLFFSPLIGILLTVLFIRYFIKDDISHGISKVLYAISKNNSLLKPHNTFSSMIASTLTIAFGGSVGAEAPIVLTGASIGSNLGRIAKVSYKHRTLLIGCGAAGAIAGIFKAPIAGIVFTIEVIMIDLTMATLIPLLLSAITASVISFFFLGDDVLFSFTLESSFDLSRLPFYAILGLFCGFVSLYFTRASDYTESKLQRIGNPFHRLLVGGVI
ncbi:MAG TPA: chloride channel protein, partial [Bacteroidales bacterium]|nr:chloride channel protein [Bacteroidales bacterium]